MDAFLRERKLNHLTYVSPTLQQALGQADRDPYIRAQLENHGLKATYLLKRLEMRGLSDSEIHSLYKDNVHLTVEGHRVWAELIRPDLRTLYEAGKTGVR